MSLAPRSALVALATSLGLIASCGSGTAGLVANGGGDDGDTNTPGSMSAFTLDNPKVSPTQIHFVLSDSEADPATVELRYQIGGAPAQRMTHISGVSANPTALATSAHGIEYGVQWDFSAESDLPDDGSYVPGIQVFGVIAGGIQEIQVGANAASTGLGNDPPVVIDAVVPSVEVDGIVGVAFELSDSSDDIVDVRVEYDIVGDAPDAGWRLARPALLESTPLLAFEGVLARSTGSDLEFFWDTDVDLGDLERDARLRFTAIDPEVEGAPFATALLHVDNNAAPIVQFDSGPLILNPDDRRGIPIPFRVIDEEADLVEVIFQWRRAGEPFPALPSGSAALDAILSDAGQRRAHRICTPYPRNAQGRVLPVDALHVRLPELALGENWIVASGVEGCELELLRPPSLFEQVTQGWSANPLVSPMGALPLGDGLTALVLDVPGAGRLREIELATGAIVREIATLGQGIPSTFSFERGGEAAVLIALDDAGAWRIERVELSNGSVSEIAVSDGDEPAPVRGIASLGTRAAVFTAGSSLLYCDYSDPLAPRLATVLTELATPWGVLVDPLSTNRLYVAENDADRVVAIELDSGQRIPAVVSVGSLATLEQPTALAFERGGARLLAITSPTGITALDLGASGGNVAFAASETYASPIASLATGADGLRLAVQFSIDELLVGGGVEQRREIASHVASSQVVSLQSPLDPVPAPGRHWRIARDGRVRAAMDGAAGCFVWDSADAQVGRVFIRATARDDELGPSAEGAAAKTVRSNVDVEPLEVGASSLTYGFDSVAADLDGDGDVDLGVANGYVSLGDPRNLQVFFQTSPGNFSSSPLMLELDRVGGDIGQVTAADLDGDDDLDLISPNGDNVAVFFQTSAGNFARPPLLVSDPSVDNVYCATAADLNGDGKLDLVSANRTSRNLTIFFQSPRGDFDDPPLVLGGPSITELPSFVAAAELNGDGRLDLVCASWDQNVSDLKVFFQTSPGNFDAEPLVLGGPSVTSRPYSVTAADLDADGDIDLASANLGTHPILDPGDVTVFFQTSPGSFSSEPLVLSDDSGMEGIQSVVAADLDCDEDLDLISTNPSHGDLTVFFQTSPGSFGSEPLLLLAENPRSATAADVDGDGDVDIVSTNVFGVTVFLQSSPGSFSTPTEPVVLGGPTTTLTPRALAASDLDGDGQIDLVAANPGADNLTIFFQASPGTFAPQPHVLGGPSVLNSPVSVASGDLDGDGDGDIVSGEAGNNRLAVFFQTSPGDFVPQPFVVGGPSITNAPYWVGASDVDGDGKVDLVSANILGNDLTVFFQTSRGRFDDAPLVLGGPSITNGPISVAVADLDGDGDEDIVSANVGTGFPDPQVGGLTVFFQTAPRRFASPLRVGAGSASAVTAADLDGDGDLDLAAVREGQWSVYFQSSAGIFAARPLVLGGPTDATSVATADLDGDGDVDVVFGNTDPTNNLTIFVQTSPGRFSSTPLVLGDASTTFGPVWVVATDLDGDGDQDLAAANEFGSNLTIFFGGR